MANTDSTTNFLDVPGARLCYDICGAGPLLLLAGPMASRGFAPIVPLLANDFTVVTYDPRGMLRSTNEDPTQAVTVELLTDDVQRLLSAVAEGPAYVFGNSGATAIGLALVARDPDRVRTFVAHEPPLLELLPDSEQLHAAFDDVYDTYASVGRNEALKKYATLTGVDRFSRPSGGGKHEVTDLDSFDPPAEVAAVLDRFFLHFLRPTAYYRPDFAALRTARTRIVLGSGVDTKSELAHRATRALADELDTTIAEFPGDHIGFQAEPEPFARTLRQMLMEPT